MTLLPNQGAYRENDGNGDPTLRVTVKNGAANPIPVNLVSNVISNPVSSFGSITSLAASTNTIIHFYTVPAGREFVLKEIEVSGDNTAKYTVEIDSTLEARKRTYYSKFNERFNWNGLRVDEGITIEVKVIHESDQVGDFDARIIGELI